MNRLSKREWCEERVGRKRREETGGMGRERREMPTRTYTPTPFPFSTLLGLLAEVTPFQPEPGGKTAAENISSARQFLACVADETYTGVYRMVFELLFFA